MTFHISKNIGEPGAVVVSDSKGGRCWTTELLVTPDELESLIREARKEAPDTEFGYRWYRIVFDEDKEQDFDDSPMTLAEAEEVLEEKRNGSMRPRRPTKELASVILDGEHILEELEAYLLLWRRALAA